MALEVGVRSSTNPSIWLYPTLRNMVHFLQNKGLVCFSNGYCFNLVHIRSILFGTSFRRVPAMSIVRHFVCAAVLLALTCSRHGHAQVLYGSLTGNVTDPAS